MKVIIVVLITMLVCSLKGFITTAVSLMDGPVRTAPPLGPASWSSGMQQLTFARILQKAKKIIGDDGKCGELYTNDMDILLPERQ